MRIVIPSALPPSSYAGELARILPDKAPALARWLSRAPAELRGFDAEEAGCTTFEAWQLHEAGYVAQEGLPLGAGLGPLHAARMVHEAVGSLGGNVGLQAAGVVHDAGGQHNAGDTAAGAARTLTWTDAPVWLAEFSHVALGADQAMLVPAADIAPTLDEARALLDAILPAMRDSGFNAELLDAQRLRVRLPTGLSPALASPLAVAGHAVRAWWQTDAAMRPWRRLLTEIQMTWYAHPVNEAREAAGRPTINALWLYGGARPWASAETLAAKDGDLLIDHSLADAARRGDWSGWLDGMAALDHAVFRPLSGSDGGPSRPTDLLLMGETRSARLALAPRSALLRWLPQPNKDWKHWWSLPA